MTQKVTLCVCGEELTRVDNVDSDGIKWHKFVCPHKEGNKGERLYEAAKEAIRKYAEMTGGTGGIMGGLAEAVREYEEGV